MSKTRYFFWCLAFSVAIAFSSQASAQSDQDRLNAFHACIDKYHDQEMKLGGGFLINAFSGRFIAAVGSWTSFMIWAQQKHPDCYAILSPAQKAAIAKELEAMKAEGHESAMRGGRGPLK